MSREFFYVVNGEVFKNPCNRDQQSQYEKQLQKQDALWSGPWWESITEQEALSQRRKLFGVHAFYLEDTNKHNYNCGHYEELVTSECIVAEEEIDGKCFFATKEEAAAAASLRNQKSSSEWRAFLNA